MCLRRQGSLVGLSGMRKYQEEVHALGSQSAQNRSMNTCGQTKPDGLYTKAPSLTEVVGEVGGAGDDPVFGGYFKPEDAQDPFSAASVSTS